MTRFELDAESRDKRRVATLERIADALERVADARWTLRREAAL